MNWQVGILAALYVLTGGAALLPGAFVVLVVVVGLAFWFAVLRTADPPVSIELFGANAAESLFPGFPFGPIGLAVVALNAMLMFPNLFAGLALFNGKPGARKRAQRAAALNLVAFPLGTPLGLYAYWALGRPVIAGQDPTHTLGDRAKAAACYAFPLVGPVFVLLSGGMGKTFVRLHAIQGLAVYLAAAGVLKLAEALPPVGHFEAKAIATVAVLIVLLVLAGHALAGRAFKLPWIGDFIEKWQGSVAGLVQQARAQAQEDREVTLHRTKLGQAPANRVALPAIEGTQGPAGFSQRIGKAVHPVEVGICAVIALLALYMAGLGIAHVRRHGWEHVNWFALGMFVVFFGGILGFVFFATMRKMLASGLTSGELVVGRWPLRPGEETRVRYRVKTSFGAKVLGIKASLQCREALYWKNRDRQSRGSLYMVHDIAMPDVAPRATADGSSAVEWTLRMPRDAPPSFAGAGGAIAWQFVVAIQVARVPDSTQPFALLVVPEMAS